MNPTKINQQLFTCSLSSLIVALAFPYRVTLAVLESGCYASSGLWESPSRNMAIADSNPD